MKNSIYLRKFRVHIKEEKNVFCFNENTKEKERSI